MRAYQRIGDTKAAQIYFDKALSCLVHHWGQLHPLHSTIYNIMAFLMIDSGSLKEAEYCYKSSLSCCSKVLGPNHIQTAEVYMDFGRLYLRMHRKSEALVNFQAAFNIYQSYFEKQSLPCGNAAFHIATIMEEQRRLDDALEYALIASEAYSKINGTISDLAICSQWLVISIAYSLKEPKTPEYCTGLFEVLCQRDEHYQQLEEKEGTDTNEDEETKERIDRIKEFFVAVEIMDTTRNLEESKRRDLKSYVEFMLMEEDKQNEKEIGDEIRNIAGEQSLHEAHKIKGVTPTKVNSIVNLKFNDDQRNLLIDIYDEAKEMNAKSIHDFYYDKIKEITHVNLIQEDNGGYGGSQKSGDRYPPIRNSKESLI